MGLNQMSLPDYSEAQGTVAGARGVGARIASFCLALLDNVEARLHAWAGGFYVELLSRWTVEPVPCRNDEGRTLELLDPAAEYLGVLAPVPAAPRAQKDSKIDDSHTF